jgi:hypothetical protein
MPADETIGQAGVYGALIGASQPLANETAHSGKANILSEKERCTST